jgi:hypothetical protein
MHGTAMIGGWAKVHNGCPIDVHRRDDHVEVTFGGPQGEFAMLIEPDALPDLHAALSTALTKTRASSPGQAAGAL